jgi:hypothetical protein
MKSWQGSCLGALLTLVVAGGSLFFFVPMGAAMIAAVPGLFEPLTARVLCPEAVDYSYRDYGFGQPTTSSPSGGTGHYTELTCTYPDGSQETFSNEEVGLKGLAASFAAAGICGGAAVALLAVLGALAGGRLAKPAAPA